MVRIRRRFAPTSPGLRRMDCCLPPSRPSLARGVISGPAELATHWGHDPAALLGYAASVGWEGDQFTFGRPAHDDLAALFGIAVHELTIYRPMADHILAQTGRNGVTTTINIKVDAFHLPDTTGSTYQTRHEKATLAVMAYDGARLDYVHNRSHGTLTGADLDATLAGWALPPFTEIARREGPALTGPALAAAVRDRLAARLQRRDRANPVTAFRATLLRDGPA